MNLLEETLIEQGLQKELVSLVEEISFHQFRRVLVSTINQHYSKIIEVKRMFDLINDLKIDNYIKYYSLPDGTVGYVCMGEKNHGFRIPK